MRHIFITSKDIVRAYHEALINLYLVGEINYCEDWNCMQKELAISITVNYPLSEPRISKLFTGGVRELQQYVMEITEGILDFEIEKGNWSYTYHDRIVNNRGINQLNFVIEELRRNPSSRRAVIDVRDIEKDINSSDPACLQHIQFFIRNGALDMFVLFRSNDGVKACFMNMFALTELQRIVAKILDVKVGCYVHQANSFHCYERDFELLEAYYERLKNTGYKVNDVSYHYEDDWKEQMNEEITNIMESVKKLKEGKVW